MAAVAASIANHTQAVATSRMATRQAVSQTGVSGQGNHRQADHPVNILSNADVEDIANKVLVGEHGAESIDLRGSPVALSALLKVCKAVETRQARLRKGFVNGRYIHWEADQAPPCWVELGDNAGLQQTDVVDALRKHGIQCCLPSRCSRRRCLYGATVHLSCGARRPATLHPSATPQEAPVRDVQPAVPSQLQAPRQTSSVRTALPALARAVNCPLSVPTQLDDLRGCRRATAVCRCSVGIPVEPFEELEVLMPMSLGIFENGKVLVQRLRTPFDHGWIEAWNLVGEACSERTFDLLVRRSEIDGFCRFLELVVERLGGDIIDSDKMRAFGTACCVGSSRGGRTQTPFHAPPQVPTFQGFLEKIHNMQERNTAGIRFPGDSYGLNPWH